MRWLVSWWSPKGFVSFRGSQLADGRAACQALEISNEESGMRGEEKANYLSVIEKKVMASIKEAAWDEAGALAEELGRKLLESPPSKADSNWNRSAQPLSLAGQPEKSLAWGVAEAGAE